MEGVGSYLVVSFSLLEITQIVVFLHFYFWNFVRLSDLEKKGYFFVVVGVEKVEFVNPSPPVFLML